MDKKQLKELMTKLSSEHPLKKMLDTEFYTSFENMISNLSIKNVDDKIATLIKGDAQYSVFKYNQGIAELLLWFAMEQKKIPYEIEVDVNSSGKNVDVKAQYKEITYNWEVKSPEYEIAKAGELTGMVAHRAGNFEEIKKQMLDLENELRQNLDKGGYSGIKTVFPKDNKIKDCLLSAQSKFADSDRCHCNVLFLCTTSEQFTPYLDYIQNSDSGFFTPNSYVPHTEFDKVNAVVLSNAISLNEKHSNASWDMQKAINLIIPNLFSKNFEIRQMWALYEMMPNSNLAYYKSLLKFIEEQSKRSDPFPEVMFYLDFVAQQGYGPNNTKL